MEPKVVYKVFSINKVNIYVYHLEEFSFGDNNNFIINLSTSLVLRLSFSINLLCL